jgi:BlaI family transcriptional regulator, penicillinase repressor
MDEVAPSGREMEILKVLWELGRGSVRDVYRRMCPNHELAFNTVQTLVRIMDDKGLVSHEKEGRTFVYTPRYSRQRATSRFLQQVFDGAIDQVVVSMLSSADPGPEELKQLAKIIAEARRRKQRQEQQDREH